MEVGLIIKALIILIICSVAILGAILAAFSIKAQKGKIQRWIFNPYVRDVFGPNRLLGRDSYLIFIMAANPDFRDPRTLIWEKQETQKNVLAYGECLFASYEEGLYYLYEGKVYRADLKDIQNLWKAHIGTSSSETPPPQPDSAPEADAGSGATA